MVVSKIEKFWRKEVTKVFDEVASAEKQNTLFPDVKCDEAISARPFDGVGKMRELLLLGAFGVAGTVAGGAIMAGAMGVALSETLVAYGAALAIGVAGNEVVDGFRVRALGMLQQRRGLEPGHLQGIMNGIINESRVEPWARKILESRLALLEGSGEQEDLVALEGAIQKDLQALSDIKTLTVWAKRPLKQPLH